MRLPHDTISYSQRTGVLLWWLHPLNSPLGQHGGVSLDSHPDPGQAHQWLEALSWLQNSATSAGVTCLSHTEYAPACSGGRELQTGFV